MGAVVVRVSCRDGDAAVSDDRAVPVAAADAERGEQLARCRRVGVQRAVVDVE